MKRPSDFPTVVGSVVGQLSLRDLLTIIFKRRLLVLSIVVTVPVVVLLGTLVHPRTYEVTATLVVNRARAEMPLAPTDSARVIVNRLSEQDLNAEKEVLTSREMIEQVLRTMEVDESTLPFVRESKRLKGSLMSWLGEQELSVFDALILHLQESINVITVRRSNAIRIVYRSENPEWATRVVETLTEQFLERRVESFQSSQAVSFFEKQMTDAEKRLLNSEATLEQFVDHASITMIKGSEGGDSLAAQKTLVMQRLSALETVHGEAMVLYQSQAREVESLKSKLHDEPERLASSNRMNRGPAVEEIERALTTLRLKRDALLQEFKADSRHVRDIDTQISMAEARLEAARGDPNVDGTEPNPVYLQLKGDLLRAETELEGIRARIAPLEGQVEAYREELDDLNEMAFGVDGLRRKVQAAEEDYLLYRKKHEEARASAAMDRQKLVNVTIAQPARMPLRPVPRGLVKRFVAGLFLGLLGGLGVAFLMEKVVFQSFTTGEDIERRLCIAHIASIPNGETVG